MVKSKNPIQVAIQEKLSYAITNFRAESEAPSVYSTAWVARLKTEFDEPQFPLAILWLHANQNEDGSWGSNEQVASKLIDTLAALNTLKEWTDTGMSGFEDAIELGLNYFNRNLKQISKTNTYSFELAMQLPKLYQEVKMLGLDFEGNQAFLEELADVKEERFAQILPDALRKRAAMFQFALECIPEELVDWDKVMEQSEFLASPSATAFAYMQTKDENCLYYLQDTWEQLGYMPELLPVNNSAIN